jgi:L-asparaginase/beta-aspartyl-peptidase (threonine type)
MMTPRILCHGGVGAPAAASDGAREAARKGAAELARSALEAVVAATVVLEDDPRFNAGTGANLRLDGRTVEMDAAVMDSDGRIGAVAAIQGVRNPILVARAVLDSPHNLLAGEGATLLARRLGLPEAAPPPERTREKYRRTLSRLLGREGPSPPASWRGFDWRRHWNFPSPEPQEELVGDTEGCDTVGAVAVDAQGRFAAASSTGGTSFMLLGRVGDSPLIGCGFYAGPAGAVTATGVGEEIMRRLLSFRVYQWIEDGASPQEACERGVRLFPDEIPVGILAVTRDGHGWAANREMPVGGYLLEAGGGVAL